MKGWDKVTISSIKKKYAHNTVNVSLLDCEGISGSILYIYKVVPDQFSIFFNDLSKGIENRFIDLFIFF